MGSRIQGILMSYPTGNAISEFSGAAASPLRSGEFPEPENQKLKIRGRCEFLVSLDQFLPEFFVVWLEALVLEVEHAGSQGVNFCDVRRKFLPSLSQEPECAWLSVP